MRFIGELARGAFPIGHVGSFVAGALIAVTLGIFLDTRRAGKERNFAGEDDVPEVLRSIGEEKYKKGIVMHRYVTCNVCQESPIRGVRYKCAYCPDFDVCESCEAYNQHPKTHLLLKISVPTPPLLSANIYLSEPAYPGTEAGSSPTDEEIELLIKTTHFNKAELLNLHEQFKCLSDSDTKSGGISFSCFERLFVKSRSGSVNPAEIFFQIVDIDKDGIISFQDFSRSLSVTYRGKLEERIEYAFKSYDRDQNQAVSREECVTLIKAYHIITTSLIKDFLRLLEGPMLEIFDEKSGNTVSSVFGGTTRQNFHSIVNDNINNEKEDSASERISDLDDQSSFSFSPSSPGNDFIGLTENEHLEMPLRSNILQCRISPKSKVKKYAKFDKINFKYTEPSNSILMDVFTEDAINEEVNKLFQRANSTELTKSKFSQILLAEGNLLNAIFDSISCIF